MRGPIRIAAVGLMAMTVVGALSSSAGAATVSQWNVQSNGGFVSLDLLDILQLSGGGSEADASAAPMAEASGTGACLSTTAQTNPCPTSPTSSLTGFALDSTQDAVAQGKSSTGTPSTPQDCTLPINTGLIDVDVSCGSASASVDGSGNPTAMGTGSLANVSISLSLTSVLQQLLGPLPAASSICGGVPAAGTTAGSNTSPLSSTVQGLLDTVNTLLPANLNLNPSSVAGGSNLAGGCSVLGGLLTQIGAAGGSSPVSGIVTGILDQVLVLTGGNAVAVQPLSIDLGGSAPTVPSLPVTTPGGSLPAPPSVATPSAPTSDGPSTVNVPLPAPPVPVNPPTISVGGISVGIGSGGSNPGLTLGLP